MVHGLLQGSVDSSIALLSFLKQLFIFMFTENSPHKYGLRIAPMNIF